MRSELTAADFVQVRYILASLSKRARISFDMEKDLYQVGCLGLIQAERSFDPSRGIQFKTFAERRIRGAIADHLRAIDPLSRRQREKVKRGEAAGVADIPILAEHQRIAAPVVSIEDRIDADRVSEWMRTTCTSSLAIGS